MKPRLPRLANVCLLLAVFLAGCATAPLKQTGPVLTLTTPMAAPAWAKLERQVLADNLPACREFYQKYFDDRGYLQCVVRWGADDGADDAFENFNRWPELHALGASDEIRQMFLKGHEGMLKQYAEAKTTEVPAGRNGMYYREFNAQSDWMHHGEGLQLFNRMGLSIADDPLYVTRARRFAGFYMGEDPEAPNYDPQHKLIRSLENGSIGPMLRTATPIDWVGDPFDPSGFVTVHRERNFQEMVAHYVEYGDVVGDSFLNLVATTLPLDAYLVTGDAKYKTWLVEYMNAWLERMKENHGIIPSFVDLDGKIGGPKGEWWKNAYGWGFSPVNPVNGQRENRNRIPRAVIGFSNALLVTGDQKYADAWRDMINAVNANARTTVSGAKQYPSMYGADGWYGWSNAPWSVGALDLWYWSMKAEDLPRLGQNPWISFLEGRNPTYPETALNRDLGLIQTRLRTIRNDQTTLNQRLADNMLDYNPAQIGALVQLMLGGLPPPADGSLLNCRLRYFDPAQKRAGVPEDVAALVSELTDTKTVVTLVNLSTTEPRILIVQGGAYGEHRIESVEADGKTTPVNASNFTVTLAPGAGAKLALTMKRYSEKPTLKFPWE